MHLQARRVFRLALSMALSLLCAYALYVPLPFLAPLFAIMLVANPGPPLGSKQLLGLVLVVLLTLGIGLLMIPVLQYYPGTGVLLVMLGLFFSVLLTVHRGKVLVGMFLAVGLTMISAAGSVDFVLALTVIKALVIGILLAVVSHHIAYRWFPEDECEAKDQAVTTGGAPHPVWIALRTTLVVWPVYLFVLTNPMMYLPMLMKSLQLGQQVSVTDTRHAARELLGSTFLAGCLAVLFWVTLKLVPGLWLFFWLMLAFGVYIANRLYQVVPTRYPASFWQNVAVTMLILLGPAVEDSMNGKDVYMAFAVRMALFVAITVYAVLAVYLLEQWRKRRAVRHTTRAGNGGVYAC